MKKRFLLLVAAALFSMGASAEQKKGVVIHPSIPPVTSAKDAPFPGWLELEGGGKTFYLSMDGRYLMLGKVVDLGLQMGQVAPSSQPQASSKVDVSKLPVDRALKFVNGNGKRVLYVFSDPDCPFCKQFESDIPKFEDTTVYLFPYPLQGLHPGARQKAASILCQRNPATAWRNAMTKGSLYRGGDECLAQVDENIALGKSLGINATPTMFNASGERAVGYVPFAAMDGFIK